MTFYTMQDIIMRHVEIERDAITRGSSLAELGADSLAVLDILMDLEEAFDLDIPDRKIGTRISDMIDYVEANQVVPTPETVVLQPHKKSA